MVDEISYEIPDQVANSLLVITWQGPMEILKSDWQFCIQKPRDRLDNSLLVVLTAVHIFSLHWVDGL